MSAPASNAIRHRLARSRLARAGGVLVCRFLDRETLGALRAEAARCASAAEIYRVEHHDGEQNRGGSPDRCLASAAGGPVLRDLYASARVRGLLSYLTGLEWRPSGAEGSYSYYCRPGHHLGIHRDVDECDLAVIVCVSDHYEAGVKRRGSLCVYPERTGEPLSALRADPERGAVAVALRPGDVGVLLGGLVPHRVLPVGRDHIRIVAPLCFGAAAVADPRAA